MFLLAQEAREAVEMGLVVMGRRRSRRWMRVRRLMSYEQMSDVVVDD
jgi:hypothetical protein